MSKMKVHISDEVRSTIKKAQRRLRNAPEFMKNLAKQQGIDRLSLRGTVASVRLDYQKALKVMDTEQFTKRGFKKWEKELANDTRLNVKTIDYALSQIDVAQMDYINNSRLRYGSNPQLDYIMDSTIEVQNRLAEALQELETGFEDLWEVF